MRRIAETIPSLRGIQACPRVEIRMLVNRRLLWFSSFAMLRGKEAKTTRNYPFFASGRIRVISTLLSTKVQQKTIGCSNRIVQKNKGKTLLAFDVTPHVKRFVNCRALADAMTKGKKTREV